MNYLYFVQVQQRSYTRFKSLNQLLLLRIREQILCHMMSVTSAKRTKPSSDFLTIDQTAPKDLNLSRKIH